MIKFIGLVVSLFAGVYAVDSIDNIGNNMKDSFKSDFWGMHDDDAFIEYYDYKDELIDSYDWDNMTEEEIDEAWFEVRELLTVKADELDIYLGHMGYAFNQFGINRGFGHMGGYYGNTDVEMIDYMIQLATIVVESDYDNLNEIEKEELFDQLNQLADFHMNQYMVEYMLEDDDYQVFLVDIYKIDWSALDEEGKIDTWYALLESDYSGYGMFRTPRPRGGFGSCH